MNEEDFEHAIKDFDFGQTFVSDHSGISGNPDHSGISGNSCISDHSGISGNSCISGVSGLSGILEKNIQHEQVRQH
jgi:hypothetical protein